MRGMSPRVKVFYAAGIMLLCGVSLFASSPGENGHGFNWGRFFGQVVNSTILFGGLIYLLRKPIADFLDRKTSAVKEDIIHREKDLERTKKTLEDIRSRLDKIEEEVKRMKAVARRSGDEEKEKIAALARKESARIRHLSEMEIDNKVDASIRRLKEKIAQLTIDHFKKDITAELDDRLHEKIIEKNIEISGEIIERN